MGAVMPSTPRKPRPSIRQRGIELFVEELAQRRQRRGQLPLLLRREAGIRHHPIGNETSEKQPLGKAEFLRAGEEQLLCIPNFLLARLINGRAHNASFTMSRKTSKGCVLANFVIPSAIM
jgi:hypothetical protein